MLSLNAFAGFTRTQYEGIRPMGMGNAFIAVANDANTLWYNPAGLANISGVHFNLIDTTLGVDSMDTLNRLNRLLDGETSDLLRLDTQQARFATKPTLITKYFGFAVSHYLNTFFDLQELTARTIDVVATNDLTLTMGVGIPLGPLVSIGASARLIQRTGIDALIDTQSLLNDIGLSLAEAQSSIYTNLIDRYSGVGVGLGFNLGTIIKVPTSSKNPELRIAGTVEDFGGTSFRAIGSSGPPSIPMTVNLGLALTYDLAKNYTFTLAADGRDLFKNQLYTKTIHLGAEWRGPIFGLRTGISEGYPTFGFSLETPPHTRIHFSTHAAELGSSLWERSIRFYTVQLIIGFNPF